MAYKINEKYICSEKLQYSSLTLKKTAIFVFLGIFHKPFLKLLNTKKLI